MATDEPNHRIEFHEATITPVTGKDGMTRYDLTIVAGSRTSHRLYETLEFAIESFDPPLSARVRSHIVEAVRGEGKPVVSAWKILSKSNSEAQHATTASKVRASTLQYERGLKI